jgi:hypothetical protein
MGGALVDHAQRTPSTSSGCASKTVSLKHEASSAGTICAGYAACNGYTPVTSGGEHAAHVTFSSACRCGSGTALT